MEPFEALYGRRFRSPIGWFDAFEVRPWGTDLLRESLEKLALPRGLSSVHPVFHISMLKKYHQGDDHVIQKDLVLLNPNMTFKEEPITIFDRQIRKIRYKEVASVKVQWKHRPVEEATLETKSDMRSKYPHLFEHSG
ncbi:uncharacterized protein [Solanum lycopersicum]|uniref:uncharacterized protein n=1 Tax=Solanum lycopersicum TaxID=4081 RepID=UPI0037479246